MFFFTFYHIYCITHVVKKFLSHFLGFNNIDYIIYLIKYYKNILIIFIDNLMIFFNFIKDFQ